MAFAKCLGLPSSSGRFQELAKSFSSLSLVARANNSLVHLKKDQPDQKRNLHVTSTVENIKGRWAQLPKRHLSQKGPVPFSYAERLEKALEDAELGLGKTRAEKSHLPSFIQTPQPVNINNEPAAAEETAVIAQSSALTELYPEIKLDRESAKPVFWKPPPLPELSKRYGTVVGPGGVEMANLALYRISIDYAQAPFYYTERLSPAERNIYHAHITAVQRRQLSYKDPKTKFTVMTVSQLILNGKCCGNGCRHCPWDMVNASPEIRKRRVWNGVYYV